MAGYDVATDSLAARKCMGYLPEGAPSYSDMTPRSLLEFVAKVRGISGDRLESRMTEVLAALHLEPVLDQNMKHCLKVSSEEWGLPRRYCMTRTF